MALLCKEVVIRLLLPPLLHHVRGHYPWVGFGPRDLRRIQRTLNLHKADILEQWHEHRARQDQ